MSLFNDPSAVLDQMEELLSEQKLNREILRSGGRGSKKAALELRKVTHRIGLLGKHFRDLTTSKDPARFDEVVRRFRQTWAKAIAGPSRQSNASSE